MIDEKKLSSDENKDRDLLSNLVRANDEFLEDGEQGLSDNELFGMGSEFVCGSLFKRLSSRKHLHILLWRTRGEDGLPNVDGG